MVYIPFRAMEHVREWALPHLHPIHREKVSLDWLRLAPPWTPSKNPPEGFPDNHPYI